LAKQKNTIDVIIETPKGYRNKYVWDKSLSAFKLKKILPEGMMFPYNFGFIPNTLADDGDPADVLVLMDEPAFPGCYIEARLIGVLKGKEKKAGEKEYTSNPRMIAVCTESNLYNEVQDLNDLNKNFLMK
jgi:inorganic pyrophosphatase